MSRYSRWCRNSIALTTNTRWSASRRTVTIRSQRPITSFTKKTWERTRLSPTTPRWSREAWTAGPTCNPEHRRHRSRNSLKRSIRSSKGGRVRSLIRRGDNKSIISTRRSQSISFLNMPCKGIMGLKSPWIWMNLRTYRRKSGTSYSFKQKLTSWKRSILHIYLIRKLGLKPPKLHRILEAYQMKKQCRFFLLLRIILQRLMKETFQIFSTLMKPHPLQTYMVVVQTNPKQSSRSQSTP